MIFGFNDVSTCFKLKTISTVSCRAVAISLNIKLIQVSWDRVRRQWRRRQKISLPPVFFQSFSVSYHWWYEAFLSRWVVDVRTCASYTVTVACVSLLYARTEVPSSAWNTRKPKLHFRWSTMANWLSCRMLPVSDGSGGASCQRLIETWCLH